MDSEITWDTLLLNSSRPTHIRVFSPVDSLKRAMLKFEGANVPAAKYSFVWSGQNARDDMIPVEWISKEMVVRVRGSCFYLSNRPSSSSRGLCEASSPRRYPVSEHRTPQLHLRTRNISYKKPSLQDQELNIQAQARNTLWR